MSEPRKRVLILIANPENRRLLAETLADRFEIGSSLQAEPARDEPSGPFDLCLIDDRALQQHFRAIVLLREHFAPLYLPVLLLADRQNAIIRSTTVWRAIDDVLYRPVERIELVARVQSMLRTRELSLRARQLTTLYEHERTVAQRLQDAALPRVPPVLPELSIDAVYRPADDATRVGGDWYDALRLEDGRTVFTIGDVSGSGLEAAVTMSQMRQVLRAVAHVHSDPALMLDAAERTLAGEPDHKQTTAFVGVFDAVTAELTYASAGHPPPMMRQPDGSVDIVPCDGLMLGTPFRLPRASQHVRFPQGAMLVLYTDGVTEANRDALEGERELRAVVGRLASHDAKPASVVADAMRSPDAKDDVAVLTILHTSELVESSLLRWEFDAADVAAAVATQSQYRAALRAHGFAAGAVTIAQTILAELLGNIVRHAPGPALIALDLEGAPVLHVLDRGAGFQYFPKLPADVLSERGRGLYIVSQTAVEFSVARRTGSGSHARVILDATAGNREHRATG